MTRSEAQAAVSKYGSQRAACAALKCGRHTLSRALNTGGCATVKPGAKPGGKTLAEFRATYDKATIIPAKVKAGLKAIGPTGWEYEVQFAKLCGVSLSDLGAFRDHFADYIVSLRDSRRAWAGSKTTAQQMREML